MSEQTRREFLYAAAGAAALGATGAASALAAAPASKAKSVIFINLVGGPSHIDTFDPKPDAPREVRGPFGTIRTRVPGLHLSELFPKLAGVADKFSLIRAMHHDAPPIHESGLQLNNTGRLFRDGPAWPNMGAVMALLNDSSWDPSWTIYPDHQIETGISVGRGQCQGFLEPLGRRADTGYDDLPEWHPGFDVWCGLAASKVERDARVGVWGGFTTLNMFRTVFDAPSWDCHADRGSLSCSLQDYRDTVAPSFDNAFSKLLTSLEQRGLLDSTLVVATGEFGRTPKLNANGGRDHWANCWTALVAGGGVKSGRILGASDASGGEPVDRPTTPQELVATVFHALGVPHDATIPGPDGNPVAVYPGTPIRELF